MVRAASHSFSGILRVMASVPGFGLGRKMHGGGLEVWDFLRRGLQAVIRQASPGPSGRKHRWQACCVDTDLLLL
jgi:hypothetical protein